MAAPENAPAQSEEGLAPLTRLRFIERGATASRPGRKILQQQFRDLSTGAVEWMDVPMVKEQSAR